MLTLLPLDNDNRVLKEIETISNTGYDITVVSVNTKKKFLFNNLSVISTSKRLLGIPGLNKLFLIFKYFKLLPSNEKYHYIHCHDLDAFVLGCIYKLVYNKNASIIYDAHEYETERNGMSIFEKKIAKLLEAFFIKFADETICVSDSIADEYVKLYKIKRPILVLNTPKYYNVKKKDIFRKSLNIKTSKTIFLYQGGLVKGRGIEILLKVFKTLSNRNAVIVFMGYGELQKDIENESRYNENIYFHNAVEPDVLLEYTSSADFGFSTIEDICLSYRYSLPNKMFEYMMAEVPLIVSNLPDMSKIVEDNEIGIVIKDNTVKGLKKAIQDALMLDKNILNYNIRKAKHIYNWEQQEIYLKTLYNNEV